MSFTAAAIVLSWIAIALLSLAMAGLLRQVRQLSWRVANPGELFEDDRPKVVTELETVDLPNEGGPTFVLFVDANCASCREVVPRFDELATAMPSVNFVAMYERDAMDAYAGTRVRALTDMSTAFARLRIPLTPFAALTDAANAVLKASPVGSPELLDAFVASGIEGGKDEAAA